MIAGLLFCGVDVVPVLRMSCVRTNVWMGGWMVIAYIC
jgi:hypothetical protein